MKTLRPGPELTADQVSSRQACALTALLTAPSIAHAARSVGVGERTLRRWLDEDTAFRAAYRQARSEAMRQASARLQAAAGPAVDTLCELLGLTKRPDIRVRAALGILTAAAKAEELENLAARVEALEASNGEKGE